MKTRLHKRATTTPAVRKQMQESTESTAALAKRFHVHFATAKKWRGRDHTEDLSSKRHHQPSSLSDVAQAAIVVLRRDVRLLFDDVVLVIRECFNPKATEASIYRCMVRNGVNQIPELPDGEARAPAVSAGGAAGLFACGCQVFDAPERQARICLSRH